MKKILSILAVLGVMAVAANLRLNRLDERVTWYWGDCSRTVEVAKYITETQQFGLKILPPSRAGAYKSIIHSSPVYYDFVSILWFFFRSPQSIFYFYAIISVISVWLSYKLTKMVGGLRVALLVSILMTINTQMIVTAWSLLQPRLMVFFILTLLIFGWMTYKNKSIKWLSGYFMVMFLGCHFHFSFLAILPIAVFWGGYFYYLVIKSYKNKKWKLGFPLISFLTSLGIWMYCTVDVLTLFKADSFGVFQKMVGGQWFTNVGRNIYELFANLWRIEESLLVVPLMVLFVTIGIYLVVKNREKKSGFALGFIFSWLLGLLLTGSYGDAFNRYYLSVYYPILFISMGLMIELLFKDKFKIIMMCLLIGYLGWGEYKHQKTTNFWTLRGEFGLAESVSKQISDDYIKMGGEMKDFGKRVILMHAFDKSDNYAYATQSFWYFLEKSSGTLLQRLSFNGDNFDSLSEEKPDWYYFVCSEFGGLEEGGCDKFKTLFSTLTYKLVYSEKSQIGNYYIYRFTKNDNPNPLLHPQYKNK